MIEVRQQQADRLRGVRREGLALGQILPDVGDKFAALSAGHVGVGDGQIDLAACTGSGVGLVLAGDEGEGRGRDGGAVADDVRPHRAADKRLREAAGIQQNGIVAARASVIGDQRALKADDGACADDAQADDPPDVVDRERNVDGNAVGKGRIARVGEIDVGRAVDRLAVRVQRRGVAQGDKDVAGLRRQRRGVAGGGLELDQLVHRRDGGADLRRILRIAVAEVCGGEVEVIGLQQHAVAHALGDDLADIGLLAARGGGAELDRVERRQRVDAEVGGIEHRPPVRERRALGYVERAGHGRAAEHRRIVDGGADRGCGAAEAGLRPQDGAGEDVEVERVVARAGCGGDVGVPGVHILLALHLDHVLREGERRLAAGIDRDGRGIVAGREVGDAIRIAVIFAAVAERRTQVHVAQPGDLLYGNGADDPAVRPTGGYGEIERLHRTHIRHGEDEAVEVVGAVEPVGLVRVVVRHDLLREVEGLCVFDALGVEVDERGVHLHTRRVGRAAVLSSVRGCLRRCLDRGGRLGLDAGGARRIGGDGKEQVDRRRDLRDLEVLDDLDVRLRAAEVLRADAADDLVLAFVGVGDVDPADALDDPAPADALGTRERDGDLVDVQLVEHVAGGRSVVADDADGDHIAVILRRFDLERLHHALTEGVGGELLVRQHDAARAVFKHELEEEVVARARVHHIRDRDVHQIGVLRHREAEVLDRVFVGHGIRQRGDVGLVHRLRIRRDEDAVFVAGGEVDCFGRAVLVQQRRLARREVTVLDERVVAFPVDHAEVVLVRAAALPVGAAGIKRRQLADGDVLHLPLVRAEDVEGDGVDGLHVGDLHRELIETVAPHMRVIGRLRALAVGLVAEKARRGVDHAGGVRPALRAVVRRVADGEVDLRLGAGGLDVRRLDLDEVGVAVIALGRVGGDEVPLSGGQAQPAARGEARAALARRGIAVLRRERGRELHAEASHVVAVFEVGGRDTRVKADVLDGDGVRAGVEMAHVVRDGLFVAAAAAGRLGVDEAVGLCAVGELQRFQRLELGQAQGEADVVVLLEQPRDPVLRGGGFGKEIIERRLAGGLGDALVGDRLLHDELADVGGEERHGDDALAPAGIQIGELEREALLDVGVEVGPEVLLAHAVLSEQLLHARAQHVGELDADAHHLAL